MSPVNVALMTALVLLAGCGVGVQSSAQRLDPPAPVDSEGPTAPAPARTAVQVYFIEDDRLVPALRCAERRSASEALRLLGAGPTQPEAAAGLRTAFAPQPLDVLGYRDQGTVIVSATEAIARIDGRNQLLALAQLVWSLTAVPRVDAVDIVIDGEPIAALTDNGLTWEPVDRGHYRSMAPPKASTDLSTIAARSAVRCPGTSATPTGHDQREGHVQ